MFKVKQSFVQVLIVNEVYTFVIHIVKPSLCCRASCEK